MHLEPYLNINTHSWYTVLYYYKSKWFTKRLRWCFNLLEERYASLPLKKWQIYIQFKSIWCQIHILYPSSSLQLTNFNDSNCFCFLLRFVNHLDTNFIGILRATASWSIVDASGYLLLLKDASKISNDVADNIFRLVLLVVDLLSCL